MTLRPMKLEHLAGCPAALRDAVSEEQSRKWVGGGAANDMRRCQRGGDGGKTSLYLSQRGKSS